MDQATQEALVKESLNIGGSKRVGQMSESELIQLVKKACREAIDENVSEYVRTVKNGSVHIPIS